MPGSYCLSDKKMVNELSAIQIPTIKGNLAGSTILNTGETGELQTVCCSLIHTKRCGGSKTKKKINDLNIFGQAPKNSASRVECST